MSDVYFWGKCNSQQKAHCYAKIANFFKEVTKVLKKYSNALHLHPASFCNADTLLQILCFYYVTLNGSFY